MSEDKIIRNLRHMAWERAKGELRSMLHTYWKDEDSENNFKQARRVVEDFIERVENEGLVE